MHLITLYHLLFSLNVSGALHKFVLGCMSEDALGASISRDSIRVQREKWHNFRSIRHACQNPKNPKQIPNNGRWNGNEARLLQDSSAVNAQDVVERARSRFSSGKKKPQKPPAILTSSREQHLWLLISSLRISFDQCSPKAATDRRRTGRTGHKRVAEEQHGVFTLKAYRAALKPFACGQHVVLFSRWSLAKAQWNTGVHSEDSRPISHQSSRNKSDWPANLHPCFASPGPKKKKILFYDQMDTRNNHLRCQAIVWQWTRLRDK